MNELKHIEEFQIILKDYQPSTSAQKFLPDTKLVLLVGPSSSGRNTIITELLKSGKYHYIVSDTTRRPRINNGKLEQDGREYWFRDEKELLADLRKGEFLEAAVIHNQQVSGMSIRELKAASSEHKIAINEIEVVGANNVFSVKPDTTFFFVVPPSFDEWMARMRIRGELPRAEIRRRLQSAVTEITMALTRDYYRFIINDTFMHTAQNIQQMIEENTPGADTQAKGRAVANQLLQDTRTHLAGSE